jgi:hypothetical protein
LHLDNFIVSIWWYLQVKEDTTMAARHVTTYAEREQFVQLHQAGESYTAIAACCGWNRETVRRHCRAFRRTGLAGLRLKRPGPVAGGPLSRFAPVVRLAALRIKRLHPAWGPAVVLDELRQRPSTRDLALPHVSQLAAYFQQFGPRLVQPRRHLRLPPAVPVVPADHPALLYQLDMQERLVLPGLGYFNVLAIRAPQWGITVGYYAHPAGEQAWQRKVSQAEARQDCRHTFARWGLPDVLQTDRDKVLTATGEYPFPSWFTLWLVGLGIEHRLIQRVIQNGSVERSHRTVDKQMLSGAACPDWPAFHAHIAAELVRLNERLPSRAKACRGQIPLLAHPEAQTPRRPYCPECEAQLFEMQRVYTYLGRGRWVRHASTHGQLSFADLIWNAGRSYEGQKVVVTFTPDSHEFVISTADGAEIKRMSGAWVSETAIRGLSDDEIVKARIATHDPGI